MAIFGSQRFAAVFSHASLRMNTAQGSHIGGCQRQQAAVAQSSNSRIQVWCWRTERVNVHVVESFTWRRILAQKKICVFVYHFDSFSQLVAFHVELSELGCFRANIVYYNFVDAFNFFCKSDASNAASS